MAKAHILDRAYSSGMDPAETDAFIQRAFTAGEDGEDARDTISSFAPDVEILV